MTREDIKALVCELFEFGEDKFFDYEDEFVRFAALVAAAEREACAKVCDELQQQWRPAGECADAIRARGQS